MDQGRLPDFIIIGAMKGGTTSLQAMLGAHPDIFVSREKELHFFTEAMNLGRGEAWYRRQFRTRARLCGEASPTYSAWPRHAGVAERMRALIPEARLIYCVRDPIDRALSQYRHALDAGRERRPIDEGILREPFLRQSRYDTQMLRYLEAGWPEARIHVVQSEAMRTHRAETVAGVLAFLGVDPAAGAVWQRRDRHVSDMTKRLPSDRGVALKRRLAPALAHVPWSIRSHLERAVLRPFSAPMPKQTLRPETRAALVDALAAEADGLRRRTGLALAGWSV